MTSSTPDLTDLLARLTALEDQVALSEAKRQIQEVELRYMRGFDRNDHELIGSAFWPDAQINYPSVEPYPSGSLTVEEFTESHLARHRSVSTHWGHLMTNFTIEVDDDTAHVESYVTQLSTWDGTKARSVLGRGEEGGGLSVVVGGRYIDRADRRDGEWRIAVREFIPHIWFEVGYALDFDRPWPRAGRGKGTWDRADPSYQRPLLRRGDGDVGPADSR